jgi:hypothetical protein
VSANTATARSLIGVTVLTMRVAATTRASSRHAATASVGTSAAPTRTV